jgi:hypothetical protein
MSSMFYSFRLKYHSVRLFCLKWQFRNFKFEDKDIFSDLCLKISRARHVVGFPSILMRRANGLAIFGVGGSLGAGIGVLAICEASCKTNDNLES